MAEYPDIPYIGPPRWYSSGRPGPPLWIVIHDTANDASARAEADYATRRSDSVSAHYYCDRTELIQSLDTRHTAYHAGGNPGNPRGIGYEITGTNSVARDWWLSNVAWSLLSRQIARDCRKWSIPARWVTPEQMRAGMAGLTTHNDCRLAWGGTTHTDPGANFPRDHLIAGVVAEMSGDTDMTPEQDARLAEVHSLLAAGLRVGAPIAPPHPNQTSGGGVPISWLPRADREQASTLAALTAAVDALGVRLDALTTAVSAITPGGSGADAAQVADELARRLES